MIEPLYHKIEDAPREHYLLIERERERERERENFMSDDTTGSYFEFFLHYCYNTQLLSLISIVLANSIRERERERDGYSTRRSNTIQYIVLS